MAEQSLKSKQRAEGAERGLDVLVPGDGPANAMMAIICDYPNEREVNAKLPLVGTSGKMLFDALRVKKYTRPQFYITNCVKRQVSIAQGNAKNSVGKKELAEWESMLQWELSQLPNLRFILIAGSYALGALVGDSKITNWRGSVLDIKLNDGRVVKAVVTNNPAMIMRDPNLSPIFKMDIHKFTQVIEGNYTPHHINPIINPSPNEALDFITKMHDEVEPISFDIEVVGGETACVGLANNSHEGMCINFRTLSENRFTVQEEIAIRLRLAKLFADTDKKFIAQNGNFDAYWLWYKDRIRVHRSYFDTLLAHHTLYPTLPHNLGFLTTQYTNHPYYKDEGKAWREGGDIDMFWDYNVKDCCITHAVYQRELGELRAQKLDDFFFNHVMRLQPHLAWMTVCGIKCDVEKKENFAVEVSHDVEELRQKFFKAVQDATGEDDYYPNPASPAQMKTLYYGKLNVRSNSLKADKESRAFMIKHPGNSPEAKEVARAHDEFAKEEKFRSTYTTFGVDEDGRVRCEYKQYGTTSAPGRLSSTGTLWGSGTNFQNQPKRAYPMFIADDGYVLVYFDLSQAEARIVAYRWGVEGLIASFERAKTEKGFDIHRGNAARIFKVPYDEVPTADRDENFEPTLRYLGKRCVHGLNYRMGPERLATACGIPLRQAIEAYTSYHQAFPEIKVAWDKITSEVKRTRTIYNLLGRRHMLFGRLDDAALESVVAFGPQSTIGDLVSSVIYLSHEDEEWPKSARTILNIHDALIAICKPEDVDAVKSVYRRHAERPIRVQSFDGNEYQVSIPADFAVSQPDEDGVHRWSTIK